MNIADLIVIAVIAAIVISVLLYIRREKKKGVRCIGCPDSGNCVGNCAGCSGNCAGCSAANKQ